MVKPFLKWAGGKQRLLNELNSRIPLDLSSDNGEGWTYIEPFLGGGAMLLSMLSRNEKLHRVIAMDVNQNLINAWKIIQEKPRFVCDVLFEWKLSYSNAKEEDKNIFYLKARDIVNNQYYPASMRAIAFIFCNKTCFNGLYRENKKGQFNVPHGSYKNPEIFDIDNIHNISRLIQNVEFVVADFKSCVEYIENHNKTFIYFDPPYRPVNQNSFTSYASSGFGEKEHDKLVDICNDLSSDGVKVMLSNSLTNDGYIEKFDGFKAEEVVSKRSISSKKESRGEVKELLITNY